MRGTINRQYHSPDNSTLGAGTVIAVRLLTRINTDVEGQVMVQVLSDVYDWQLTGKYEKKTVNNGRVPVTFNQLILPNGGSWTISENMVAIDGAGYTGIAGKVHHHTGQKISAGQIAMRHNTATVHHLL